MPVMTRRQARLMAASKKSASKKSASKSPARKLTCFRKTRKAATNKGLAGSKYVVCLNKTKKRSSQKGGAVRAGSVQQFVQKLLGL